MKITRKSEATGVENTLDLPVTQAQLDDYYVKGMLLQDAFPLLPAEQREFIKTGITPEEWEEIFPPEKEVTKEEYLGLIAKIRSDDELIKREPDVVAYMVRDWDCTTDAGLDDLCWALCRDGSTCANDVIGLLDQLEAYLKKEEK